MVEYTIKYESWDSLRIKNVSAYIRLNKNVRELSKLL